MKYHNITKDDMLNGDGLRVVLWVAGCEHKCEGCQNKFTWDKDTGLDIDANVIKEIYNELDKDYISGITISGGDPLAKFNRNYTTEIVKNIRAKYKNKKTIWIYTGYKYEEIKDLEVLNYIDVLVDGKFILKLKDDELHWVGSRNQRVIDMKQTKVKNSVVLKE